MRKITVDLEKLRGALSGKQTAIAKKIGMTQGALSHKVNRRRPITLDELNQIAEILERNTSDFLVFEDQFDRRRRFI